jgi:hydroxyacylglutathione hydrolase
LLGGLPEVPHRSGFEAQQWVEKLGLLVDARPAAEFAAEHIRGSLNIPGNASFASWFGSLIDYGTDVWLLASDEAHGERLVRELMSVGFDRIVGVGVASDALIGVDPDVITQRSAIALSGALGRDGLIVLDVRSAREWRAGHIAGSMNIPLAELPHRLQELPADGTLVTQCASGGRSSIAASLLLMAGATSVENLSGGIEGWTNAGFLLASQTTPAAGDDAGGAASPGPASPDAKVAPAAKPAAASSADDGPEIPRFVDRRRRER